MAHASTKPRVTRTALQNAATIAELLLTTECVVVERKEDNRRRRVAPGWWHGRDVLSWVVTLRAAEVSGLDRAKGRDLLALVVFRARVPALPEWTPGEFVPRLGAGKSSSHSRLADRLVMSSNASSGLIYDVGLHVGHDTAFYLGRGFRVLAIEADPALANKAAVRFEREIAARRLTILNVGIAEQSGESTFWICDDASAWNSFSRKIASRDGSRHHAITIPTMTIRDVFALHGVPDYMKIDIEGNDHLCLLGLDREHLPRFISLEAECLGDAERISEEDAIANLDRLHAVGYNKFKLISQADLHAVGWRSGFSRFALRAIHALAGGSFGNTLGRLARPFTVAASFERRYGVEFPEGSSGPWGDEADGGWLTCDQARHIYLERRHAHFSDGKNAAYSFWHDWHATI